MPSTALNPPLTHGSSEASIDTVNIAMRQMPWYQDYMRSIRQDPGHPTLTKEQSHQVLRLAQANGIEVDEGDVELDNHGNFNPKGHKLRNTLIVVGIAAATIATMGAAGAFSGAAGAGSAAAGAGGAGTAAAGTAGTAGVLGSTAIGTGAIGGIAGGTGLAAAGVGGTAATLGGAGLTSMAARYGLNFGGQLASNYIQARATGKAADAQQRYLEEALAYEKEKDAYERTTSEAHYAYDKSTADAARALEAQRYGDREGRLAPYRATGQSANASMAAFLGQPAPEAAAPRPFVPTTPLPFAPSTSTAGSTPSATTPTTTAPTAPAKLVTVRAPTGATRQVPEDQVAYWESRGASVVEM